MLIDTDVFIWFLWGKPKALDVIETAESISISSVTYMELIQGARSKQELKALDNLLTTLDADILHINEAISELATASVRQYYHSHSVELKDALIGATGVVYQLPLATANYKHFKQIEGLELQVFKP